MAILLKDLSHGHKVKLLKTMDDWLREHINSEDCLDPWLTCGVPDGSNDVDFEDFADDEDFIIDCLYEFVNCVLQDTSEQEEDEE